MLLRTGTLGQARFALTDRHGGASTGPYAELNLGAHVGDEPAAVAENRRRLVDALPGADRLALMSQVHGSDVAVVGAQPAGSAPTADALVTAQRGVALAVLAADCVPVLLAGRDEPVVAVVHAGRRGVEGGVVAAAVRALGAQGVPADALAALVGPAVCGRCYEVPAAMRTAVAAVVPQAYATSATGTASLDLPAAVAAQLAGAGVRGVERVPECTAESERLFSHRRDGVSGRSAGVLWLPA